MWRSPHLAEIRRLDPERDHQRIVHLCACYEFPFDMVRSLEFGLFRTFAAPSISALLDRTGEFGERTQRRYDDTDLIVSALMGHGYESDLGRAALRRMNAIHGRFTIANEDYLYVLSTFVFEPARWIGRFGPRPLSEPERLGLFHFWRAVGRRMGIRDIPSDYAAFEAFNRDFERQHFRPSAANARVGGATRAMFVGWAPGPVRPLARRAIDALLDDPLIEAFGFARPAPWMRRLAAGSLRLRGRLAGLLPPRRRPLLRTELRHRSYPSGYRVEDLGPPAPGPTGD